MADIYLFRHGETHWNRQKLYQGQQNSELTEKGISDITQMARRIENISFLSAYCSPLGRTRQTLDFLAPKTEKTIFDDRLKEIALGELEGKPFDQVPRGFEMAERLFWEDPENFRIPGAETFREVHDRVMSLIRQILTEKGPVLAVTHTVPVRIFLNWVYGRDFNRFWEEPVIPAGSLIHIQTDPLKIRDIFSPAAILPTGSPL